MHDSKIEWVLNPDNKTLGKIWNPITGCLNHTDGLCKGGGFSCYAYKLANGRLKSLYLANDNLAGGYRLARGVLKENATPPNLDPFYPRFWPERLSSIKQGTPLTSYERQGIFVCDMSDLFGIGVPEEWIEKVFWVIQHTRLKRYYLLTKQPQNLRKWSPFPDNCWVGVTATNTRMALEACLKLGDIEAPIRYLSIEPMLNPINLPPEHLKVCKIGWLIIGAQTKPSVYPKIEWVQEIVEAADKAGIPIFLKDNLKPLILQHAEDKDAQWADMILDDGGKPRQEIPHA